jgi:hypothetical protein
MISGPTSAPAVSAPFVNQARVGWSSDAAALRIRRAVRARTHHKRQSAKAPKRQSAEAPSRRLLFCKVGRGRWQASP